MNLKNNILFILIYCFSSIYCVAQDTIFVKDFGVLPDNKSDVTSGVQKAIEACRNKKNVILYFAKGRYDFYPTNAFKKEYYISNTSGEAEIQDKTKTIGLFFQNMKGITLEGNSSLFVFHGKMTIWALDNCENIKFQNVSFDFENPTMAEMTVKEIYDSQAIVEVHKDTEFEIVNNRIEFFGEGWRMEKTFFTVLSDPKTGMFTYSSFQSFRNSKAELLNNKTVKFTGDFSNFHAKSGDVLSIRDCIRDEVGALILHSKNIKLENVIMHYMHGLGIVAMFSENLNYKKVAVKPRNNSGRLISSFADAFHFSGCKGEIIIDSALCSGMHDDFINIHGTHLQIVEKISPTILKIRFMHHQTYGFQAFFEGDSVAFLHSASLQVYDYGIIKSAKLISKTEMQIELESSISDDMKISDCIENLTYTPSVIIRNSKFEGCITRGILVTTRKKILIENNMFYKVGMHAILIANDAQSWYESGPVNEVIIRNNIFQECGYNSAPGNYIIAISPENHEIINNYWVHRNVLIENNIFKVYDFPILTARSTYKLIFRGNKIIKTQFLPQGNNRPAFNFTSCTRVQIVNNQFQGFEFPEIQLSNMSKFDIQSDIRNLIVK